MSSIRIFHRGLADLVPRDTLECSIPRCQEDSNVVRLDRRKSGLLRLGYGPTELPVTAILETERAARCMKSDGPEKPVAAVVVNVCTAGEKWV